MESPLETLRTLYEEWGRGDFSRDVLESDIESHVAGMVDMETELRGADQVRTEMRKWLSAWEDPLVIEADEFIEAGDQILVLIRWRGRGKGSGVEMEAQGAHLWTFKEGRAVRWDVFRDRDEARAALAQEDPSGDA